MVGKNADSNKDVKDRPQAEPVHEIGHSLTHNSNFAEVLRMILGAHSAMLPHVAVCLVLLCSLVSIAGADGYKYLFVDDRYVASSQGVEFVMNPPYQDHEPVLVSDQPWEGRLGSYSTIIKEGERFRLWYFGVRSEIPPDTPVPETYEGFKEMVGKYPNQQYICYAESSDGVNWEKPNLGLYEFEGSKDNNIVLDPEGGRRRWHGCCVFIDPHAPPEERYKMWSPLQTLSSPDDAEPAPQDGIRQFYSADGIHWTMYGEDKPNPGGNYDSLNIAFWDVRLEKYVGYKRNWFKHPAGYSYRGTHRVESPDFRDWKVTHSIRLDDVLDQFVEVNRQRTTPIMDFYTQTVIQYPDAPDVYLMFPSAFWHWGGPMYPASGEYDLSERGLLHKGGFPDGLDVQLAVSQDGIKWTRVGGRHPFLRLGPTGKWDCSSIYAVPGLVAVGDEMWIYYGGNSTKHGQAYWAADAHCGIFRARLRRDGFVSADACYQGGELITVAVEVEGDTLQLNADTSAGGVIRVELLDTAREPIPGFTLADADELNGNECGMEVTWGGSSDLSRLVGSKVHLRLVMRDCKVYAFQFVK